MVLLFRRNVLQGASYCSYKFFIGISNFLNLISTVYHPKNATTQLKLIAETAHFGIIKVAKHKRNSIITTY